MHVTMRARRYALSEPTEVRVLPVDAACLTQAACEATAIALGLSQGHANFAFASAYQTKGCYTYSSGTYANVAFFGTGGSDVDMRTSLTSPKYRPPCTSTTRFQSTQWGVGSDNPQDPLMLTDVQRQRSVTDPMLDPQTLCVHMILFA